MHWSERFFRWLKKLNQEREPRARIHLYGIRRSRQMGLVRDRTRFPLARARSPYVCSPAMLTMFALVGVLCAAPPPAPASTWPASAGRRPDSLPVEYSDPKPRYFDPPPGRYVYPDGSIRDADPPPGFYDPPPGYYPVDPALAAAYRSALGPLPTAEAALRAWEEKRRRLRIGLGVSGGILGLSVLAYPISMGIVSAATRGEDFVCIDCYPPGIFVTMVLGPPALVATIVYAVRLGIHARRRPKANLSFGPGGLLWRF